MNKKLLEEALEDLDSSLDVIIESTSPRLYEASIDQAATWIQKALLKDLDVDKSLRKKSFLDFTKLTDSRGRAITQVTDLERALDDISATDLVREAILSAFDDYKKYNYDGSGLIRASTAGYNSQSLTYATQANRWQPN